MMGQKLAIITGCTSGIGLATAKTLSSAGYDIFGVARNAQKLTSSGVTFAGTEVIDFSKRFTAGDVFRKLNLEKYLECVLINNAGTIDPIVPFLKLKLEDLEQAFRVNFLSVIALTQSFYGKLHALPKGRCVGRIINISTGAAFNGYAGWTAYCTSKAALELFTQVSSLEMDPGVCQVMSLAPGVVESNMQVQIRAQHPSDFPDVERFKEIKETGRLYDASVPAEFILKILKQPVFPKGKHLDLRKDQ